MPVDHGVLLSVHATVDGVHQAVAPAQLRMLDEGCGEDPLAGRGEGYVDRIVHAPGHDDVDCQDYPGGGGRCATARVTKGALPGRS